MVFREFYWNILLRILLITLTCLGLGLFLFPVRYPWLTAHVLLLVGVQAWLLIRYTNRWNTRLSDFFSQLQGQDYHLSRSLFQSYPNLKSLARHLRKLSDQIQEENRRHEIENEYFKVLSQKVATGIIVTGSRGEVQYSNPAALHAFGIPALRHLHHLDRYHPGTSAFFYTMKAGEYGNLHLTGVRGESILLVRCSELVIEGVPYRVFSLEDIEREIKKQELESWQQLIRILNHEIMNSISPITSTVQALADGWKGNGLSEAPEQKLIGKTVKGLQIIRERSEGLKNFVEAYRSLTKVPEPEWVNISLQETVEPVRDLFAQTLVEKQVKLVLAFNRCTQKIRTDPALLQQVLINLVRNALDAIHENTTYPAITINCSMDGDGWYIEVEDNGEGMDEEVLRNATIPFFTTKPDGSGIGLSLVRQLISALQGELNIRSTPGKGTTVKLDFGMKKDISTFIPA